MPRISRAVAVGYPHHITQRGNYRQTVFKSDEDFNRYFQLLQKYSDKYSLKIWAYCLMSNHVHYVAVPMNDNSLAKTFNALHMMYSRYFNQKSGGNGHLWQGRFFSCVLDELHVYAAVRYVENNPVRANMVDKPEDYKWSSAGAHVYKNADPVLAEGCYLIARPSRNQITRSPHCSKGSRKNLRKPQRFSGIVVQRGLRTGVSI